MRSIPRACSAGRRRSVTRTSAASSASLAPTEWNTGIRSRGADGTYRSRYSPAKRGPRSDDRSRVMNRGRTCRSSSPRTPSHTHRGSPRRTRSRRRACRVSGSEPAACGPRDSSFATRRYSGSSDRKRSMGCPCSWHAAVTARTSPARAFIAPRPSSCDAAGKAHAFPSVIEPNPHASGPPASAPGTSR